MIYRQSLLAPALEAVVVLLVVLKFHFSPHPIAVFWLLILVFDCGMSLRRAVILDERYVKYRPPVGSVIAIPLSDVISVERVGTAYGGTTFFQKPGSGLRISTTKQTEVFTVMLRNSDDLVRRLLAAGTLPRG